MGLFDRMKKKSSNNDKDTDTVGIDVLTPEQIKSAKESQDIHLYTQVIHYSRVGLAILISYTEEYFYDMVEFISMCTRANIHTIAAQSTYEEDTGKTDSYGDPVVINHNRYYVIVSATVPMYALLYKYSSNLANNILNTIKNDIYSKCNSYDFMDLIEDSILNADLFIATGTVGKCVMADDLVAMDTADFMKRIPSAFKLIDVIHIALVDTIVDGYNMQSNITIAEFSSHSYTDKKYESILNTFFLDNMDKYFKDGKLMPFYMIIDDDDSGDMSDADIDDIFKEHYDKFSPVADDMIQYKDIDEVVEDE